MQMCLLALTSCVDTDPAITSVQEIDSIFQANNPQNSVHYRMSYDSEFPCSATLQESWELDGERWMQRYRFDIQDIEPGTFLLVKQAREAIIYDAELVSDKDGTRTFPEKKIAAVRYRASLGDDEQVSVLQSMLTAIAACEDKYGMNLEL
jgi:hypothetical protein